MKLSSLKLTDCDLSLNSIPKPTAITIKFDKRLEDFSAVTFKGKYGVMVLLYKGNDYPINLFMRSI